MLELINNKIIVGFAVFGAVFSFILSLFSGNSILDLLFHTLISGILMGGLGFGLNLYFKKTLSEEDYQRLFKIDRKENDLPGSVLTDSKKKNIDVTDESADNIAESYENLYKNDEEQRNIPESYDISKERNGVIHAIHTVPEVSEKVPTPDVSGNQTSQGPFQEDDFNSIPRVFPVSNADDESGEQEDSNSTKNDLTRLGEVDHDEKIKKSADIKLKFGGEGVKFKVGKKNITADPKLIAEAIKTVLHRD